MTKNIFKLTTGIFFTLFFAVSQSSALSCMYTTMNQSLNDANSVFVGKVLAVDSQNATFEVAKYWKGNLGSRVTLPNTTYWTGMPGGSIFFNVNNSYIVFTSKDQNGIERTAIDCAKTSQYSQSIETEITNILGLPKTPGTIYNPYPTTPYNPNNNLSCPRLTQNLWQGNFFNNSSEVAQLQTFLYKYYGVEGQYNTTGYFGRVTKSLVSKFQREQNLYPVTGGVGPLTRAAIARQCTGVVGGDRDEHGCIASAGYSWCSTKNKCLRTWEESCTTNDQVFCPAVYQPVCGQEQHECCGTSANKPAYCMYAKVACEVGTPKTYGNSCELGKTNAKYLYEGECRQTNNEAPANCKTWYDGCNTCSRTSPGGQLACTLMYCFQNSGAYCKEYFSGSTSEAPSIKSFSGPTQLNINQTGTWKVDASIFNNQQLTYNISWGDERNDYKVGLLAPLSMSAIFPQNTTFEHSYSNPGTYTVTITVTAANGQSAKTTSTVVVTNNNYYNNYPVACTSDARQCPNGAWVGRTGPNCEFICPAY